MVLPQLKRRKTALLTLSLLCYLQAYAQVVTTKSENPIQDFNYSSLSLEEIPLYTVNGKVNLDSILAAEANDDYKNEPPRFGVAMSSAISMEDGVWTETKHGRVWMLRIFSPKAKSLNLHFDKFFLSEKALLYLYRPDHKMVQGPFTSRQNKKSKRITTDLIDGDELIIQLIEPYGAKEKSILHIDKVIHGYKGSNRVVGSPDSRVSGYGDAASCTIDIECSPEGDDWQTESDAVAMIIVDGTRTCSGSLLNNTCNDLDPYFLTAFHCLDDGNGTLSSSEIDNLQDWVLRFQYKSPTCNGSDDTNYISIYDVDLVSEWQSTDMLLLDFNRINEGLQSLSYSGWSRSPFTPSSSATIGHPQGDVMKIAIDDDASTTNTSQILWLGESIGSPSNSHWSAVFDDGTTQGGSSGGPFFDQNERLVGQLHGGASGCTGMKWFGRFDVSWNGGGTATTRLRNWLDPSNSGDVTTNTIRSPYMTGSYGSCLGHGCTGTIFQLIHPIPGQSITWSTTGNATICYSYGDEAYVAGNGTNGVGVVTATLSGTCSPISFTEEIQFGSYALSQLQINGPFEICPNSSEVYELAVSSPNYPSYYDWDLDTNYPGYFIIGADDYGIVYIGTNSSFSGGILKVRANSGCGWSSFKTKTIIADCSGSRQAGVYPNPVKNTLNVNLSFSDNGSLISIQDVNGKTYYHKITNQLNNNIDVSKLKRGVYYLRIVNETETDMIKFMKQ